MTDFGQQMRSSDLLAYLSLNYLFQSPSFMFLMLFWSKLSRKSHFSENKLVCDGPILGRTDGWTHPFIENASKKKLVSKPNEGQNPTIHQLRQRARNMTKKIIVSRVLPLSPPLSAPICPIPPPNKRGAIRSPFFSRFTLRKPELKLRFLLVFFFKRRILFLAR